jgi:hypothetical protein
MKRRRHTPEQIIRKLAEGEKLLSYRGSGQTPKAILEPLVQNHQPGS